MATHMRATVLAAVIAAVPLFLTQPVQAATAAVQPHSIIFHQASDALIENIGSRGGWGYRRGVYRHSGWGYRRGVYRRGLYGSRYGYYRPYRRFYGAGVPAYSYGYGNGYDYANDYDYADDGYANDYGYADNGYGYGGGCGCGYGNGYGYGAPVVTFGFGGW